MSCFILLSFEGEFPTLFSVDDKVKHCRSCKRCVPRFDHHCPALNNCVGKRNFKVTVVLFNSGLLLSLMINIAYAMLVAGYFYMYEWLAAWRHGVLAVLNVPVKASIVLGLGGAFAVVNTAVIFSLLALVGYHWYNSKYLVCEKIFPEVTKL